VALADWVELVVKEALVLAALADWVELVVSGMVATVDLADWVELALALAVEEMADGTDSRTHCSRTCP